MRLRCASAGCAHKGAFASAAAARLSRDCHALAALWQGAVGGLAVS